MQWAATRSRAVRSRSANLPTASRALWRAERNGYRFNSQGLYLRPGSALVPWMRRLRDPGPGAEGDAGAGRGAREHGLHLGHRMLEPLSVLHEHLRIPYDSRPRAGGRHRAESYAARPRRMGGHG